MRKSPRTNTAAPIEPQYMENTAGATPLLTITDVVDAADITVTDVADIAVADSNRRC